MILTNQNEMAFQNTLDRSGSVRLILNSLNNISNGSIKLILPDGEVFRFQGEKAGPEVKIKLQDLRAFDLILQKSDIGLGEAYMLGYWETHSIPKLIEFALKNRSALQNTLRGSWYKILFYKLKHLSNVNSKTGSKKNIHAHYDMGNDFYSLWLDESMTYSSAYWGEQETMSLNQAQSNKYALLLRQLNAKPGSHILEIGCGWGGFAEFAASQGMRLTGVTISQQQYDFALNRINKLGLSSSVDLKLMDYRDITGTYDHVISIEMLEAVGESFWQKYFQKISSLLKPGGSVAIQTITIDNQEFERYRKGTDFIQQYIFPGGMLPCEQALVQIIQKVGGKNLQFKKFGPDYARTLKIWSEAFSSQVEKISALGYSSEFQRMWTFYLGYCEGAFRNGQTNVVCLSYSV
jgi:cyclopropane-fatty-acyl-phospholipid synthase